MSATVVAVFAATLAGCSVPSAPGALSDAITVTVTESGCELSHDSAPSGTVLLTVVNAGDEVAAVWVRADGVSTGSTTGGGSTSGGGTSSALGGIGNIAPGISRDAVFVLPAGDYLAECTAGPTADAISAEFSITDSGATIAAAASLDGVADNYLAWVHETSAELRTLTSELAVAFVDGDPSARQLYPETRALWSSLRPALQRFPELLPAIEGRESDLVSGERLSGWHAIEKDLWPPLGYEQLDATARTTLSARLVSNVEAVLDRIDDASFAMDAAAIAAGGQDLLDAASRSLSDGDEAWSHTELDLVRGDLDGASAVVDALRPVLKQDSPALLTAIDDRTTQLREALGAGTTREVATRVDALAAALAQLRAVIAQGNARIDP